jgi:hypothetical protein
VSELVVGRAFSTPSPGSSLTPLPKSFHTTLETTTDLEFVFFPTKVSMMRCCVKGCQNRACCSMSEVSGSVKFEMAPVRRVFDRGDMLPAFPLCEIHRAEIVGALQRKGIKWGVGQDAAHQFRPDVERKKLNA